MARIKGATMTHKRRKKMLKLAKGFYGCKSKHFKMAKRVKNWWLISKLVSCIKVKSFMLRFYCFTVNR